MVGGTRPSIVLLQGQRLNALEGSFQALQEHIVHVVGGGIAGRRLDLRDEGMRWDEWMGCAKWHK